MTTRILCSLALCGSMALAGCSKSAEATAAPESLPASQVKSVFGKSFANAGAETRAAVEKYETAVQNNDAPAAFVSLQELRARPDLTQDQRMTLGRAMRTTSEALQAAIAAGDDRAQQVLQEYQRSR